MLIGLPQTSLIHAHKPKKIVNDLIQQGDIAIALSSNDDQLLKDNDKFSNNFDYLSFQQHLSKHNNWLESTLYENNHIELCFKKID